MSNNAILSHLAFSNREALGDIELLFQFDWNAALFYTAQISSTGGLDFNSSSSPAITIVRGAPPRETRLCLRPAQLPDDCHTVAFLVAPNPGGDNNNNNNSAASILSEGIELEMRWMRPSASFLSVMIGNGNGNNNNNNSNRSNNRSSSSGGNSTMLVGAFTRRSASEAWSLVSVPSVPINSAANSANSAGTGEVRGVIEAAVAEAVQRISGGDNDNANVSPSSSTAATNNDQQQEQQTPAAFPHIALSTNSDAEIVVAASWDVVAQQKDADLDLACLVVDSRGAISERVFWGKLTGFNGAIEHSGDNETGDGDGDDESITVELGALPENAVAVFFVLSKYNEDVVLHPAHNVRVRVVEKNVPAGSGGRRRSSEHLNRGETFHQRFSGASSQSVVFAAAVRRFNRDGGSRTLSAGAPWHLVEMNVNIAAESALDPAWQQSVSTLVEAAATGRGGGMQNRSSAAGAAAAAASAASSAPPQSTSNDMRQRGTGAAAAASATKQSAPLPTPPPRPPLDPARVQQQQNVDENAKFLLYAIIAFLIIAIPFWFAL